MGIIDATVLFSTALMGSYIRKSQTNGGAQDVNNASFRVPQQPHVNQHLMHL